MPLLRERTSLEPYYARRRQARQEFNIAQERGVERARIKREEKEREKKREEETIRQGRVTAKVAGIDVEEPRGRLDGGFRTTYAPTERRRRTISAYQTALGKEAIAERQEKAEEQKFLGEYKEIRKEALALEKRLKEERKIDESITLFFKDDIGKTFLKGTPDEYTLDTPEEAIFVYRKRLGRSPSDKMLKAIYKLKWPAGGVVETGRTGTSLAERLLGGETGGQPEEIDYYELEVLGGGG